MDPDLGLGPPIIATAVHQSGGAADPTLVTQGPILLHGLCHQPIAGGTIGLYPEVYQQGQAFRLSQDD